MELGCKKASYNLLFYNTLWTCRIVTRKVELDIEQEFKEISIQHQDWQ